MESHDVEEMDLVPSGRGLGVFVFSMCLASHQALEIRRGKALNHSSYSFFYNLFLKRGEGSEKERERNIDV